MDSANFWTIVRNRHLVIYVQYPCPKGQMNYVCSELFMSFGFVRDSGCLWSSRSLKVHKWFEFHWKCKNSPVFSSFSSVFLGWKEEIGIRCCLIYVFKLSSCSFLFRWFTAHVFFWKRQFLSVLRMSLMAKCSQLSMYLRRHCKLFEVKSIFSKFFFFKYY